MLRAAFLVLLVLADGRAGLGNSASRDSPPRIRVQPGESASFSAATVRIQQNRLIVTDLHVVDPDSSRDRVAGRVLIDCDPWTALALWATKVGQDMAQATPFLGTEGPGAPLQPVGRAPTFRMPLTAPARVTLMFVGRNGLPGRQQTVTIMEVEVSQTSHRGGILHETII